MASPPFSFSNSEFDSFLYATVGEEKDGAELTVLSALARFGLDPWVEAARLSDLPREAAAKALAATIALLPAGTWTPADVRGIAIRLANCLPTRQHRSAPIVRRGSTGNAKAKVRPEMWLACGAVAMGLLFALTYLTPDSLLEFEPTTYTQRAPAPAD